MPSGREAVKPRLSTEYERAVVPTGRPRLSWIVETDAESWQQAGYELRIELPSGVETYVEDSAASVLVDWPARELQSRERALVAVRLMDESGRQSAWSDPLEVTTGLLDPADWTAVMVSPPALSAGAPQEPVWLFRREFEVVGAPVAAHLYVSAHGVLRAEIGGERIGDELFAPGWSAYRQRLRVCCYDVTHLLRTGTNAIGAAVADGWWRGYIGGEDRRAHYGERVGLIAQLEIELANGERQQVVTDRQWRAAPGPTLRADLYLGETFDARRAREFVGWSSPSFDDALWARCRADLDFDPAVLVGHDGPPVRRIEEVVPVAIEAIPDGTGLRLDYGADLVGRLRLSGIDLAARDEIVIRYGDVTDHYVAAGTGDEAWEPEFTFHGFRCAELTGWNGKPRRAQVVAQVCHSDVRRTGWFSCSDPRFDEIHEAAIRSVRGNLVDVPTNWPQRDDRLGWTGDLQALAPSACFLYDCRSLVSSWLADLVADQMTDGGIPFVIPNPRGPERPFRTGVAAAWADAAVLVPWTIYERFGDAGLLERQLPSMRAFVEACVKAHGPDLNAELFQFGDWPETATDPVLIAGAFLIRSLSKLASTCRTIGRHADSDYYGELAGSYRRIWQDRYWDPEGFLRNETVTAYALAVGFEMLPAPAIDRAGVRLREICEAAGHQVATGFIGTPLLCDALTRTGGLETAYAVAMHAVQPSLVVDWMHRVVGGLAPAEPGYRAVRIAPRPGGGVTSAAVRHDSGYGKASVEWHLRGGEFSCEVTVAPNTTAELDLPIDAGKREIVGSGTHRREGRYVD